MRIVIDMQGAQTESRFRGIGRYTMSFVQAVVKNRDNHEVILVLNSLFPEAVESIRTIFNGLLPQKNIKVWYADGPVAEINYENNARRNAAELLREEFISALKPDVLHICSLFEGYIDDAVNSIGKYDKDCAVSVALYDLIPLLNEEHYLTPNPSYAHYYLDKIDSLKKAKICLAISEFSRQEGLDNLPFNEQQIVNVSTAIDPFFKPVVIESVVKESLLAKFKIIRPFVLYTGGADERKNLPRLIEAYSLLPADIRLSHQLFFAGKMSDGQISLLQHHARKFGLNKDELCFSGYISDEELLQLYNLCKVFVFPSWHEGFGLPALEAMACGAAVITSNSSSLPEVVDLLDAQFDPFDAISINEKLKQALTNDDFLSSLMKHGLERSKIFSWDDTAKRAIHAWEGIATKDNINPVCQQGGINNKLKLAFVSPLPPERTGIADYSAELIPVLSQFYDIDVIVVQSDVSDHWINKHCAIRDVSWFVENSDVFDRVLYQVGNSPFHQHMLQLMHDIPGTVVLHDFYLSGLIAWLQMQSGFSCAWDEQLYLSHGYKAIKARYDNSEKCKISYPVNFSVLQQANGVIVHSMYSKSLADEWYPRADTSSWKVIPLLRTLPTIANTELIREDLGFDKNDFVICSFGFIDDSKLNHRLLECWLASELAEKEHCHLVFVGENHCGEYGRNISDRINNSGFGDRIKITGFASQELFESYLSIADLAVQLRTQSRGETSKTVFDCMSYGKPVIVNANGSMAEIERNTVLMLADEFSDNDLISAIQKVYYNADFRIVLGQLARDMIRDKCSPAKCAQLYYGAIEQFYKKPEIALLSLVPKIAEQIHEHANENDLSKFARLISLNHPLKQPQFRIFLDITATCQNDHKTGIERVAKAVLLNLLDVVPAGYRVEPVYLEETASGWVYKFARNFMCNLLGFNSTELNDDVVNPINGDILLTLDNSGHNIVSAASSGLFLFYRNHGVKVWSIVYDLLPVTMSDVFPPGADIGYSDWLHTVTKFDGAICISKSVADDLREWCHSNVSSAEKLARYKIDWCHLGADVLSSAPSTGLPQNAQLLLETFAQKPTFLMVGTIEPRKGYLEIISEFSELWADGHDLNLVIVGKEGWGALPDNMRRNIPETVCSIINNKELNHHLFWLNGISDEFLEKVYSHSSCLIAASYGEGFGLPLIEGAQHNLPIIARDIPVFREVAAEHAYYFDSLKKNNVANAILKWCDLYKLDAHPSSEMMPYLTWVNSSLQMLKIITNVTSETSRSV